MQTDGQRLTFRWRETTVNLDVPPTPHRQGGPNHWVLVDKCFLKAPLKLPYVDRRPYIQSRPIVIQIQTKNVQPTTSFLSFSLLCWERHLVKEGSLLSDVLYTPVVLPGCVDALESGFFLFVSSEIFKNNFNLTYIVCSTQHMTLCAFRTAYNTLQQMLFIIT